MVRQPETREPHRKLYDVDDREHVVLIAEWGESLLVNGKGGDVPSVFAVKKGRRYRFRVAYVGGQIGCPVTLKVDRHLMKVIALDGNPTNPYEASSVVMSKGERLDFILKASQESGTYSIQATSDCLGEGTAALSYEGGKPKATRKNEAETKTRKLTTAVCERQLGMVCLGSLNSLKKMPEELRGLEVARKMLIPFDYRNSSDGEWSVSPVSLLDYHCANRKPVLKSESVA